MGGYKGGGGPSHGRLSVGTRHGAHAHGAGGTHAGRPRRRRLLPLPELPVPERPDRRERVLGLPEPLRARVTPCPPWGGCLESPSLCPPARGDRRVAARGADHRTLAIRPPRP